MPKGIPDVHKAWIRRREVKVELYEVIMAGGGGTRFWPLSRRKKPKQFVNVSGNDILLNETIIRMDKLIKRENVYIVTNAEHQDLIRRELVNGIPFSNILTEPVGRNTAPCILYAASVLAQQAGDGIICVTGSDYHIQDAEEYCRIMENAAKEAEQSDCIVTIGIKPTYPATGFGYILSGEQTGNELYKVEKFVEKPDLETAKSYLESGRYTWNSGVFVFKASVILNAYQTYLPQMFEQMQQIIEARGTDNQDAVLQEVYPQLESISVDYGIMEKINNMKVIPGDFGWSDVGSLDELKRFHKPDENGNICIGETICIDSQGCIASSEGRLLTLVGLEDIIAVETGDAVLVCRKDKAQDVKKAVEELKNQGKEKYL